MPGRAVGRTTFQTISVRVVPMAMDASRILWGTPRIASAAVNITIGNIRIDSAKPPAQAEKFPVTSTTTM